MQQSPPVVDLQVFPVNSSARSTLTAPDRPAYLIAEAARYARVAPATLRTWVKGRVHTRSGTVRRYAALIHPADSRACVLSFNNLIEAHVLRSLRSTHEMALPQLRKAIKYAESELGIERLLLSQELQASAGELFLEKYGQLINLNRAGQLAMRTTLERYLRRVEWDADDLPHRLFPFTSSEEANHDRRIMIDPKVSFGRPILAVAGVATSAIVERIDAGEAPEDVAADYGVTVADVTEAVVYEQAA